MYVGAGAPNSDFRTQVLKSAWQALYQQPSPRPSPRFFSTPQLPERKVKPACAASWCKMFPSSFSERPGAELGITCSLGWCPRVPRLRPALPGQRERGLSSWSKTAAWVPLVVACSSLLWTWPSLLLQTYITAKSSVPAIGHFPFILSSIKSQGSSHLQRPCQGTPPPHAFLLQLRDCMAATAPSHSRGRLQSQPTHLHLCLQGSTWYPPGL